MGYGMWEMGCGRCLSSRDFLLPTPYSALLPRPGRERRDEREHAADEEDVEGPHLDPAEAPCGEGERCAAGDGDEPFPGPNAGTTAAFDN
jgi:hypothetical protein